MATFTQPFLLTSGESPAGTSVTTTSQQISASQTTGVASAAGPWDTWMLTAAQQVSRNGVVDTSSSSVTRLYYTDHVLYRFNGTNWFYFNSARTTTTLSWTLAADPTIAVVPDVWNSAQKSGNVSLSVDGLTATLTVATATDECVFAKEFTAAGSQCGLVYWEVVLNSANVNGMVGIGVNTSSVTNGSYLGHDTFSLGWRGDTGTVFINSASVATFATYAAGSRLCFALDLANGKLWGRVGGGNWNNAVITSQNPATNLGGFTIPTSIYVSGSTTTFVVPGASLTNNTDSAIASFERSSWLFTPPVGFLPWSAAKPIAAPTIQSIVLTGTKAFTTGTNNAVVGTVAVTLSSGTFNGVLSTAGPDAASFQIPTGTNTLETNGTLTTARTYSVNVVASQPGASNSPLTGPTESIVGSGSTTVAAPAEAVAAGYNTLVFSDDFTDATTVSTNRNDTFATNPSAKWFWGLGALNGDIGGGNGCTVQTTLTAATIPLGQGAGNNASPSGGILVMNGGAPYTWNGNNFITTIPNSTSSVPAKGVFRNFCVEYYIAYDPAVGGTGAGGGNHLFTANGFPAVWSWDVETMDFNSQYGATGPLTASPATEIDFLEDTSGMQFQTGGALDPLGTNSGNAILHPGGNFTNGPHAYTASDNKWHRFSFVHSTNGDMHYFKDGVQAGTTLTAAQISGFGSPFNTASHHLFIILGTGINWPVYIDYVRVWQGP